MFISSIAGITSGSRLPAYDTSKAALGGLMRHITHKGTSRGIRANVVAPGLVDTPLGRLATVGVRAERRTSPLGVSDRLEIAYACCSSCQTRAST